MARPIVVLPKLKVNFRVPAEFEIAIGIEIHPGNVRLIPILDSDFDPDNRYGYFTVSTA
jgi:hypothetical protein